MILGESLDSRDSRLDSRESCDLSADSSLDSSLDSRDSNADSKLDSHADSSADSQFYSHELSALKKRGILRTREVFDASFLDFASNDYLGLSNRKKSLKRAFALAFEGANFAPRASMLVNGYSALHKRLETRLCEINGFESGILVGSGFLGNLALFESLIRKNDVIFIDEKYHASGLLAAKLLKNVVFFKHNDSRDLAQKIAAWDSRESSKTRESANLESANPKANSKSRKIIAIEGIYSMDGDIASADFAKIACESNALLIVDEAHSSGVLGRNLNGYFDFHNIKITPNFIKLGTFSKAYGAYGAYILASAHIIDFLQTRAKPIIYSTALSAFDTALALVNLEFIHKNRAKLRRKIEARKAIISRILGVKLDSQIFCIQFHEQEKMLDFARTLKKRKILVGAIRAPSVESPILRIILSLKNSKKDIFKLCDFLQKSNIFS